MKAKHIAIVGATGAVGREMLDVLRRRRFPIASVRLLASGRSAGTRVSNDGGDLLVAELREDSFAGVDLALFSAGGAISRQFAPHAVKAGAVVIDNSSAFRQDAGVPLVIPEINAADAAQHRGIIANPNCTIAVALMALAPLHREFGLKRVFAASYQAVSGTGAKAIEELRRQIEASVAGRPMEKSVYPHQIAFNVLPHIDSFRENGYTGEEMKMQDEARKILHHPALRLSATCVRVPVYRAHSVALNAEFERPVAVAAARAVLAGAPGLRVVDDPAKNEYPMPLHCAGKDACEVGRLRLDCALENGLAMWVAGDQLLKGAALNAVQIAELL
ncbi:aspartate-semialdehyde dehydrogenase [Verrucomicrobia bacterium SCGC AG-212-E04]|nr:aspartate-semialdehyde dehydrogenase [Verrucomicrobia bacterium SCGC AG-212-E04]